MRCSEIINILEELAPHRMACEWDNPGLLAGRKEKKVKKLLLCVDADDEAVALAVRQGRYDRKPSSADLQIHKAGDR